MRASRSMRAARKGSLRLTVMLGVVMLLAGCARSPEGAPATPSAAKPGGAAPSGEVSGPVVGGTQEGSAMRLESSAFVEGGRIPTPYCWKAVAGGENRSVPLSWSGAPDGTASLALAMVDRHPIANDWVHWLVIDIPTSVTAIPEGASGTASMPAGARELDNTFGSTGYGGPAAPPGTGDHRYETTVYALSLPRVELTGGASIADFERAIQGNVLAKATLTGVFSR